MAAKRSKSRGRDLKHTETQAAINVSRRVSGEKGRTDGVEKIGAVSAAKPGLRRRKPRVKATQNMTRSDVANSVLPDAYVTKSGLVKMLGKDADTESDEKRIAREKRERDLLRLRMLGDNPYV
jgi:hypothetical protein